MSHDDAVTYTVSDRVATIAFNRPDTRNAWSPELEHGLHAAIDRATADDDARAIVMTGNGPAFCVGASMTTLANRAGGEAPPPRPAANDDDLAQRYSYLLAVPKPLIAGINGGVAGVGFCLTLYCDIRFMAEGAKLSTAFARRGLVAEHGSGWLLPRLVGPMNAADLLMSGRPVPADEAARMGLVRTLPAEGFREAVQAYASDMANLSSPRSIRLIKQQLWESTFHTLAQATQKAEVEIDLCRSTEDYREGSAHYMERRKPRFTGR